MTNENDSFVITAQEQRRVLLSALRSSPILRELVRYIVSSVKPGNISISVDARTTHIQSSRNVNVGSALRITDGQLVNAGTKARHAIRFQRKARFPSNVAEG